MCSNCDSNYFAIDQNATYIKCEGNIRYLIRFGNKFMNCSECFDGCAGGCTASGPSGCRECRSGYTMEPEIGCKGV